jgi:hypothetical protein
VKCKKIMAFWLAPALCFAGYISNPQSILIIGNSFTFYNGGVDSSLNSIYQSTGNAAFYAERVANSGWYLRQHFASPTSINTIKQGHNGKPWDVVVLQGYSNEAAVDSSRPAFYEAVKQLDSIIKTSNSNTYLELTWSYKSVTDESMFNALVAGYDSASALIGHAPIIPAGYSFMSLRDSFNIYADDKHPTESGTYLIACTFYGFFTGTTPVGITWTLNNVAAANVNIIQRKAWAADLAHPYVSTSTRNGEMQGHDGLGGFNTYGIKALGKNVFSMDAPAGTKFTVLTVSGKNVKRGILASPHEKFDLSGFSKGMYIVNTASYVKTINR